MFDDCKGEKLQELQASFSTIVLRKLLAAGQTGKKSIAGQLAIAKSVTSKEHKSLIPLAIAHRASLVALLRRKRELRARYRSFGRILDIKERELDERFEGVLQTQTFLNENVIPDHTVSRLSALFEKHWQGDSGLVNIIAHGEEQELLDSLLDRPFQDVWPEVSEGTFDEEIGTTHHGLLQDLEKRVAAQEARLKQWKDFKEAMQKDTKPRFSPKKQDLALKRTTSNDEGRQKHRERDLVFSPRKSPRKSGWELDGLKIESSPTPSMPKIAKTNSKSLRIVSKQLIKGIEGQAEDEALRKQDCRSMDRLSLNGASQDDTDDSGFSEVSGGQLHVMASPDNTARFKQLDAYSAPGQVKHGFAHGDRRNISDDHNNGVDSQSTHTNGSAIPSSKHRGLTSPNTTAPNHDKLAPDHSPEAQVNPEPPDEDDLLAAQIISMTINAAPTPKKPTLSLEERTRKSIAFASLSKFQGPQSNELPPPTLPPSPTGKVELSETKTSGPTTLLERTRKSISLLPPKPKSSCKSTTTTHERRRRSSKIYPTNQFETPKKQQLSSVSELTTTTTPPEQLFSPTAGYDSVFKSRPKIANSPTPSPVLLDGRGNGWDVVGNDNGEGLDDNDDIALDGGRHGKEQWEDSPLDRVGSKV